MCLNNNINLCNNVYNNSLYPTYVRVYVNICGICNVIRVQYKLTDTHIPVHTHTIHLGIAQEKFGIHTNYFKKQISQK